MRIALLAGTLLASSAAALAQVPTIPPGAPTGPTATTAPASPGAGDRGAAGPSDLRVNQLIIYGEDPCPQSTEEEIVVCVRRPDSDRYRVPENLRDIDRPQSNSWANRAIELSYVGRTGTDSCSPVGAGGFTGCLNQIISAARAERAGRDEVNWNRLIEQARQERLGRIDEQAEEEERRAKGVD
jgi:hypothetical protein